MSCRAPIAGLVLIVGLAGCGAGSDRRGYEYMPDMAHSVPLDSFAPNPVMRDGKTLQRPPAGTIPRGFLPFRYRGTAEDRERAGRELHAPTADAQMVKDGQALYEVYCLVCHGDKGQGDGPLVPKIGNPPSYSSPRVSQLPPGQLYHVITLGSGRMPSYASQIPSADRWKIISYVQVLQSPGAPR